MSALPSSASDRWIIDAAQEIAARGQAIGLPLIATCANISSARPITIDGSKPVATLFEADAEPPARRSTITPTFGQHAADYVALHLLLAL